MTILAFDTETTGLLDFKLDLMDATQPRVVQLAAVLLENNGDRLEEMNCIIKPDGWIITEQTSSIHGLTNEICEERGVPMLEALNQFNSMKARATQRMAFNIDYDKRMMAREAQLYGVPHDSEGLVSHCVMRLSKNIVKCPPTEKMMACGRKDFKNPKLSEAYLHFFGREMENAHDAMADVNATVAIWFAIQKLKAEEALSA